jgi:hypothetical protein
MRSVPLLLLPLAALLTACGGSGSSSATDTTPPAAPTGLLAAAGDGQLTLTWQANTEPDLESYLVSWRESASSTGAARATPSAALTLTGLVNDRTYFVTVVAVDRAGNSSAASSPAVASPRAAVPDPPPAMPGGLTATAQDGQVALHWTPNAEPDLARYTVHYGAGASLDRSLTVEAPATSTVASGLSNGTAYSFALEAEDASGGRSLRSAAVSATPMAAPAAPVIRQVALAGYGLSNQVRQGASVVELIIQGTNLQAIDGARLGGLDLTIQSRAAGSATLTVDIPHGAPLGDLDLTVRNAEGTHTLPAAVEVTRITAATRPELNPSDLDGKGTPNRPFRTATRALAAAGPGDTVLLAAGIYSDGEVWPAGDATNVPDGVALEGQSSDRGAVVLQGPAEPRTGAPAGLSLAGSASVRNLTLRGFGAALFRGGDPSQPSGALVLENVAASASFDGLLVRSAASVTVSGCVFSSNGTDGVGGSGIHLVAVGEAHLSATRLDGNVYGLTAESSGEVRLEGLGVKGNRLEGLTVNDTPLTLSDSTVEENLGTGVSVAMRRFPRTVSLTRLVSRNNGSHGFIVGGAPRTVSIYQSAFQGNADWQLLDLRDAGNADPLYAFFCLVAGRSPEDALPSLSSGAGSAEYRPDGLRAVRIENPGNTIFFTL